MKNKRLLAMNARLGDGNYWKHPECVNYKIAFVGVNRAWIKYKADLMNRPVFLKREAGSSRKGVFANAAALWSTISLVDEFYTEFKDKSVPELLAEMTLEDLVLWFLDDGCTTMRKGKHCLGRTYKHLLCVGDLLYDVPDGIEIFLDTMRRLFPKMKTVGTLCKNNSKTTERNLVWNVPVPIAKTLIDRALLLNIPGFENKLRTASMKYDTAHPG